MRVISHRGNIDGPGDSENQPYQILRAISMGYEVEIDVWLDHGLIRLGHDKPEFLVDHSFLSDIIDKAWIHCKNFEAVKYFTNTKEKFNFFWHENDQYTLTSLGFVWTFPGMEVSTSSVVVLPELYDLYVDSCAYAVCTDYPLKF